MVFIIPGDTLKFNQGETEPVFLEINDKYWSVTDKTVCHTPVIFGKSILRFHVALFMSAWISFDCGLTKWHHNSSDSDPLALYSSMLICVFLLINMSSIRVINWAECEIWRARAGLCGLPLHSDTTETYWHECQMSEGVWRESSSIYHLDTSGLDRQTAFDINN